MFKSLLSSWLKRVTLVNRPFSPRSASTLKCKNRTTGPKSDSACFQAGFCNTTYTPFYVTLEVISSFKLTLFGPLWGASNSSLEIGPSNVLHKEWQTFIIFATTLCGLVYPTKVLPQLACVSGSECS